MSSLSRDGGLQAAILSNLGSTVVSGSSSRGGVRALKGLIDQVRRGSDAAFAMDGPRGPAFEAKPGAAKVAVQTGGALIPITSKASSAWRFSKTWDDYRLPKPFSRVEIRRGDPITIDTKDVGALTDQLQRALRCLENSS